MSANKGFTLLEVVVAGGILAVGILGLLTLQAQSLQAQQRVRVVRELVSVAEGELDFRLVTQHEECSGCQCSTHGQPGTIVADCRVMSEPCHAVTADPCGGPSAARARRVSVVVESRGGKRFTLQAIAAAFPAP